MTAKQLPNNVAMKADNAEWRDRSVYWTQLIAPEPPRAKYRVKKPERLPLVLTGNGVRLRVDHGALLVQNGFTHYPQQREQWRLFTGDRHNPSRIVVVDGNGSLSFDVLSWLSSQNIPLCTIDWRGNVISVAGGSGRVADETLARAQRESLKNGRWQRIVCRLVSEKVANSISTLGAALPPSAAVARAVSKLSTDLAKLKCHPPTTANSFRGIEGRVGSAYFSAWQSVPLRWKGLGRAPIPDDWKRIGQRQSLLNGKNFNASHPVNAMLNYAYGMLENQVRVAVVSAGLDPTIGYLHASHPDRHALVYDAMEPWRPLVDAKVLQFVQQQTFAPSDFTLRRDGVCRLNPQLARALIAATDIAVEPSAMIERLAC